MDEEEVQKALDKKFKEVQDDLQKLQKEGASKSELEKATSAIEKQGLALQDFIDSQKEKIIKTYSDKLVEFLHKNKDEISRIYKARSGEIVFNPFADKAVGDISTESGTDEETVPVHRGTTLGSFNLRNDNTLMNLFTVTSTSTPSANYTEMLPKEGDYEFVSEGGKKPQIDFSFENRYPKPKKIAAYEILTEEVVTDYARMESVAREYLKKKHDLFKVNALFFADGTGELPTGATVYGRSFVAGDMALSLPNGSTKFMDLVNAAITDIYTTQNFVDEEHYMANFVGVSPVDFFLEFQAAKDANGLPVYPQASLFNQVNIGGVTIKPWIKIPKGKVFIADITRYNVVNYVPFSIRIGWINDQFIHNKFTMLGESRFFQYVKNLDQAAFIYEDIETIRTAIEATA